MLIHVYTRRRSPSGALFVQPCPRLESHLAAPKRRRRHVPTYSDPLTRRRSLAHVTRYAPIVCTYTDRFLREHVIKYIG